MIRPEHFAEPALSQALSRPSIAANRKLIVAGAKRGTLQLLAVCTDDGLKREPGISQGVSLTCLRTQDCTSW